MTLPIRYTRRENVFVWARRRALGEDGRLRCLLCLTPLRLIRAVAMIRGDGLTYEATRCPHCSGPVQPVEPRAQTGAIAEARI